MHKVFEKSLVEININNKLEKKQNSIFDGPYSNNILFMELEFGLAKWTTVQVRLQYFFHLEKIKKQNTFPCKFPKNFKGPSFHC